MQWFDRHENLVLVFPGAALVSEFLMLVSVLLVQRV